MRKITFLLSLLLCTLTAMAQTYTYSLPAGYADASATDEIVPLTSEQLMAKTDVTYLVLKCVAKDNNQYFKGTSSGTPSDFSNIDAEYVFVWEPAGDGKFYLRKADGTYLQNTTNITLGNSDNAAKFYTTQPILNGSGETDYNDDGSSSHYYEGTEYFVRFVKEDGNWVNVQGPNGTPKYHNDGFGSFTLLYAYEVEATIAGLKISDAPVDGNWAENTTWYKIQNKKESEWLSTSAAYCNTENYLVLTNQNEPNDDYGLWCIVGDVTNGFKFYNKGEGTSKALSGSRNSNSGSASFIMSESTDVDNVKFDIANSLKAGYIIIKDHNNGNTYWNHRDNNLAYWNSAGAQTNPKLLPAPHTAK